MILAAVVLQLTEHLQAGLQVFLLLIAFICVPWMLLAKPYFLKKEHDKRGGLGYAGLSDENLQDPTAAGSAAEPGDPRPSEEGASGHVEVGHGGHEVQVTRLFRDFSQHTKAFPFAAFRIWRGHDSSDDSYHRILSRSHLQYRVLLALVGIVSSTRS